VVLVVPVVGREDDAPAPARAYRGTTSLAAFRRPLVSRL